MKRLKLHTEKHQIEKLSCHLCHKEFRSSENLHKHLAKCESSIKYDISSTSTSNEYINALNLSQSIYQRYGAINGFSGHTTT